MRNFSVIFKPIWLYYFFAIMRLFLIKDGAFISLCVKKKKEIIVFVKKFLNFMNKKFRINIIMPIKPTYKRWRFYNLMCNYTFTLPLKRI